MKNRMLSIVTCCAATALATVVIPHAAAHQPASRSASTGSPEEVAKIWRKAVVEVVDATSETVSLSERRQVMDQVNRAIRSSELGLEDLWSFHRYATSTGGRSASTYFSALLRKLKAEAESGSAPESNEKQQLLASALNSIFRGGPSEALESLQKLQAEGDAPARVRIGASSIDTTMYYAWSLARSRKQDAAIEVLQAELNRLAPVASHANMSNPGGYRDAVIMLTAIFESQGDWDSIETLCEEIDATISMKDPAEATTKLIAVSQLARAALRSGDPIRISESRLRLESLVRMMGPAGTDSSEAACGAYAAWLQEIGLSREAARVIRLRLAKIDAGEIEGHDIWVKQNLADVIARRAKIEPSVSPRVSVGANQLAFGSAPARTPKLTYKAFLNAKPFERFSLTGKPMRRGQRR